MGQNLILNVADHDFTIVVFNRTVQKVDHFLENEAKGPPIPRAKSSMCMETAHSFALQEINTSSVRIPWKNSV